MTEIKEGEVLPKAEFPTASSKEDEFAIQLNGWLQQVERVQIKTEDDFANGGTMMKALRALKKAIDEDRSALVSPMNNEVKRINARYKELFTKPIDDALAVIRPMMDEFAAQREILRAEQIEKERKEKEERALAAAAAAEEAGSTELADQELAMAETKTATERVSSAVTSTHGVQTSARTTWSAEECDIVEICRGIADGVIPADLVTTSKMALNRFAAEKKEEGIFCGIKVTKKVSAVAR